MPILVGAPKARVVLYGEVRYQCQRDGCTARTTLPEDTYWWDTQTYAVLSPPNQPPAPPNDYIPFCSAEHLPSKGE